MMVEAAIALPVFIVAVVTLVMLIKACMLQIVVFGTMQDQVRKYSVELSAAIENSVQSTLEDEHVDGSSFSVSLIRPVKKVGEIDDVECLDFKYETDIKLPAPIINSICLKNRLMCRKWDGMQFSGEAFGFERMKNWEEGNEVFIFPHAGGRFHHEGCRYINSYAQETVLTPALREKYDACPICTEGDETDGQTIYIFQYGSAYHEADCSSVDKYVISMDMADAKLKGYTACSVCGR